jgi:hypothetical protein
MLCLMSLANQAPSDELAHQAVVVRHVEGCPQLLQRLLDTLMFNVDGLLQHQCLVGRRRWHEHPALEQDHNANDGPTLVHRARLNCSMLGHQLWQGGRLPVKLIEHLKCVRRQGKGSHLFFFSTARQSIDDDIETPWLELDQELDDLVMLRDHGELLVQEVLQAKVVGAHDELTQPKVRLPMADDLDQADQLTLVGDEFGMMGRHDPAEEGHKPLILMQDYAHAQAEALQSTMKARLKSGSCSTCAVVSAALREWNAATAAAVQLNMSHLRIGVSGVVMSP